jgi:hypothetical protein
MGYQAGDRGEATASGDKASLAGCRAHRHDPVLGAVPDAECEAARALPVPWRYWLNRRWQKHALSWNEFNEFLAALPLPKPKIVHAN